MATAPPPQSSSPASVSPPPPSSPSNNSIALLSPPPTPPPLAPPPSPPSSPSPSSPPVSPSPPLPLQTPPPPSSPPSPSPPLPPSSPLSPPPPQRASPPPAPVVLPSSPPPPGPAIPVPTTPPVSSPPPPPQSSPPILIPPSPPTNSPSPSTNLTPPPPLPGIPSPGLPSASPPPPINASPGPSFAPPPPPSLQAPSASAPLPNPTTAAVNNTPSSNGRITSGAAIGVTATISALAIIAMILCIVRKRKKNESGTKVGHAMPSALTSYENSDACLMARSSDPLVKTGGSGNYKYSPSGPGGAGNSRSCFTHEELVEATKGFSAQNLLGEGGFGCVYRGFLLDGREVAVKQLKIGGDQGEREFKAEVEIISRVHHRHLVSLVGYCISEHQRMLVYDYVPNNTLHYHLHDECGPTMKWTSRVKVAAGAAHGIAYLHEDCHPRIIHRDIKSSNILLDNKFEAQVSDFGLAKLALDACTHVTTRVMGTFGYVAPEYASSGKLTEKSDVFSFGVVLLELITGRKPVDASQPLGEQSLVEWARPLLSQAIDHGNFTELVDPRLEKDFVETEMLRMIEAAAASVRHSASKRPRMSQVVRALDSMSEPSDLTNGMKPGESEMFRGAPDSAQIRMFRRMAFGSHDSGSDYSEQITDSWTGNSSS